MIARILILLSGVLILASCQSDSTRRNTADAQIEKRIDELISRMTVEEKIGQTNQLNRLRNDRRALRKDPQRGDRLPAQRRRSRRHQHPATGRRRTESSGHSASDRPRRDPRIPHRLSHSARTGRNVRPRTGRTGGPHRSHRASAAGIRWTFSPMLDISRDPRWGRIAESAGEDPCLTSAMGAAMVKDIRAKVRTTRPPSPHAPSTSWATEPARAAGTTTRPT